MKAVKSPQKEVHLKIRKVDFQYSEIPRFYYENNPFSTHFINALHLLFPDGERFFIDSMIRYKQDIDDPKLKKDIKMFCGQEGIHGIEHEKIVKILMEKGYKTKPFLDIVKGTLKRADKIGTKVAGKSGPLILTVCLEHFTALFAEGMLQNIDISKADPQIAELFQWHAAEELEHKCVAFDLLQEVDGNEYAKRVVLMPIVSFLLYAYIGAGTAYFLAQDRENLEVKKLPQQLNSFVFKFLRQFHSSGVAKWLDFFKRDFHPNHHDNYHLAEAFLEGKRYA